MVSRTVLWEAWGDLAVFLPPPSALGLVVWKSGMQSPGSWGGGGAILGSSLFLSLGDRVGFKGRE